MVKEYVRVKIGKRILIKKTGFIHLYELISTVNELGIKGKYEIEYYYRDKKNVVTYALYFMRDNKIMGQIFPCGMSQNNKIQ